MIKFNEAGLVVGGCMLLALSGCTSIKSHFPDKEKDYQFSSEIAPLAIPTDLSNAGFRPDVVPSPQPPEEAEQIVVIGEMIDGDTVISNPAPKLTEVDPVEAIQFAEEDTRVDFVMFDGGATRLRINERFAPSWRLVAKALTRNRLEITGRNKAAGLLTVQYDPDATEFQDESVWDELVFVFGGEPSLEKEYRIRVMEHNYNTEVIVLDAENQPLSDGVGLKLLKLLFSTIHNELEGGG